jgi:hypothetical protein
MKWHKWNNILHRDIGYLCVGMTIVYAISGVAVNHIRDWNPNYSVRRVSTNVGPVVADNPRSPDVLRSILTQVGESPDYRDSFRPDSTTLEIFLDGGTVTVDLPTGDAELERVTSRTGLREANFLHLNHAAKLWTWVADLYAVALLFLAISGLFVIKGKKGIKGRGGWLTAIGIAVPIFFLWIYF